MSIGVLPPSTTSCSTGVVRSTAQTGDVRVLESTLDTLMRCLELANEIEKPSVSAVKEEQNDERSDWPHDQHLLSDDVPSSHVSLSERVNAIKIVQYKDESLIGDIMRLITKDLSEPYSIYTYRYFIHNWPELCLLAYDTTSEQYVGVVVCKVDQAQTRRKGYIAMLAIDESCRRLGIGTRLVRRAIELMAGQDCDEVVLETEVSNVNAMRLYSNLGFIREKRLFRYYLNGVDAFRLKLYFSPPPPCQW